MSGDKKTLEFGVRGYKISAPINEAVQLDLNLVILQRPPRTPAQFKELTDELAEILYNRITFTGLESSPSAIELKTGVK